jgi:GR25 family glycosyltransferase involved in LPS biosynthesis
MAFINQHLQITTKNSLGIGRRERNSGYWTNLHLSPHFVSQTFELKSAEFFDENLKQKISGIGGCIATHRKAWSKISSGNKGFYLITEDDSLPTGNFLDKLYEIERELFHVEFNSDKKRVDEKFESPVPILIQLGWSVNQRFSLKQLIASLKHLIIYRGAISNSYVRYFSYGTHCYLLNKEMAEFLLANISSTSIPLDVQFILLSQNPNYATLRLFRSLENYSFQERADSNIEIDVSRLSDPTLTSIKIQSLANANCHRQRWLKK